MTKVARVLEAIQGDFGAILVLIKCLSGDCKPGATNVVETGPIGRTMCETSYVAH